MLFLFIVTCSVLPIYCQSGLKISITCFSRYEHEETRSQTSNQLLSYAYHEAEITSTATHDGIPCSTIGCACFSYRTVCSSNPLARNHYSQCTDDDRRNHVVKWHRGWSSNDECERMRQQSQTYQDLTCCYTDKCNDQPGLVTKLIDPAQTPIQSNNMASNYQGRHYGTFVQPTPLPNPNVHHRQPASPQYQTPRHHVYQTQPTAPATVTYSTRTRAYSPTKSYADYERNKQSNRGSTVQLFSLWFMILFFLMI